MQSIELHDFEALLHVSVAFNFFYSSFNNFSENITIFFSEPLLSIPKKALTKISENVEGLKSSELDGKFYEEQLKEQLDDSFINLSNDINNFTSSDNDDLEYGKKFKSAYLLTGFYSLLLLIICGFHGYYNGDKLYHTLCTVNWAIAILLLYITISSFFKPLGKITAGSVLLIFFILIIGFPILYNNLIYTKFYDVIPNSNYTVCFSVILVLSPFLLHFIRILIAVAILNSRVSDLELKFNDLYAEIKVKANKLDEAKKLLDQYPDLLK